MPRIYVWSKIKRQANCTCLSFYGGDEGIRKEWNDGIASETNLFVKTSVSPQGFECDIVTHAIGVPLVDGKRKNGHKVRFMVEMRGFVLAFRKTKMLVYAYVLLNASVIAKNDGCPPFF